METCQTKTMPHAGHDEHLCYLANMGFMLESPDEFRTLVKDPQFMCRQCGRGAQSPESLCKPEKI
jgi:hypothetical protein